MGLVGEEYLGPGPLGLLRQGGLLRYENLLFGLISLDQPLLGTPQDKPQAVQVVQTTAAAQLDAKQLQNKLPHHLPVPAGQFDARQLRQLLGCCLQLRLLRLAKGKGESPVCSNIKVAGPPSPKADAHHQPLATPKIS